MVVLFMQVARQKPALPGPKSIFGSLASNEGLSVSVDEDLAKESLLQRRP